MTQQVVFCFAANEQFVADIRREHERLRDRRNVDLQLVYVTDASSIEKSDYKADGPYRFVLFLTESEPPSVTKALEAIASLGKPHRLCLFVPDSRFSPERINEILRMTPDPTRERKNFAYPLRKEQRTRGIAVTLTRACAEGRI